ncbi:MAG: hypothetical protein AB1330_09825 [Bacillota bacterium]
MLWLETERGSYRLGDAVKVGVFARGFEEPGWQGERCFKLWAVNPSGVPRELTVASGGGEECAAVEFLPGETGVYTVAAAVTGEVNFSARAYFCVERERNLLPPPVGEGLVIAPVWYEGSYLNWPVCLETRFNGERFKKRRVTVFPGFWQGEKLYRVTDMAGRFLLDGRNWCYWKRGKEKEPGVIFSPWGVAWVVRADYTSPEGARHVATCTVCPEQGHLS